MEAAQPGAEWDDTRLAKAYDGRRIGFAQRGEDGRWRISNVNGHSSLIARGEASCRPRVAGSGKHGALGRLRRIIRSAR